MSAASLSETKADRPILRFEACTLPLLDTVGEAFTVDLLLCPGDLLLLETEDVYQENAISDAACGLLAPLEGRVVLLDRAWSDRAPNWSNAARGRIGIVFREDNWIPYLSMMENIILPQLYHTRRSVEKICEEAAHWANRFGLPGLPLDLPAAMSAQDRQAANLARAFIGDPSLVIIEQLPAPPSALLLQTLVNAIRERRERGAAVLWLTQDRTLALNDSIPATRRLRLGGVRGNSSDGSQQTQREAVA